MRAVLRTLLLSMLVLWNIGTAGKAAEFNDGQRQEIETVVKNYLLAHPELLREMMQILEQKEKLGEEEQKIGRASCRERV